MQRTQDIATYCPGTVTVTIMVDGMDDPLPERFRRYGAVDRNS